eukprot:CAMPEP_0117514390 /NCGR_PEP_ID=MMETSP0784-20121206/30044_1 /TAXON_ID=39447 /ORGANISM="" /LENGTH=749 /DNA_ID=CAMNT_0005310183 /DNA_START=47 /DNA_END=2296 /DNA_ORIENTATION=-
MLFIVALLACTQATALKFKTVGSTRSPVEKVVVLLKDLEAKIKQDGEAEQLVYDKYACWCEKATARKADAIESAQGELKILGHSILKFKAQVATLTSKIKQLAKAIADNEQEQAEATSLRRKENEAYMAETTEVKQALAALHSAIQVLVAGAKPGAALLQQRQGDSAMAVSHARSSAVRAVMQVLPTGFARAPTSKHLALLAKFAEGERYAPQSWTVQGILKDMYETFAADLESATSAEATANRNFESFIATKTETLQTLKASKATKEAQRADAEALLADTTKTYDDTEAQMKADIAFFDATKSACETKHAEWSTRSALRSEELRGVAAALDVLTSDSARELFASSIKAGKETGADHSYDSGVDISGAASLLQVVSNSNSSDGIELLISRAYTTMRKQATAAHSLRLAALAVRVREMHVGHFDEVIKAIDAMTAALQKEDAADIAKRDQCKEEYKNTASAISHITWLIEKNVAKIDKLMGLIRMREEDLYETNVAIADVNKNIQAIKDQRSEDNMVFLRAKKDDQDAIELLVKARTLLQSYYTNHSIDLGPIQGNVKDYALAQQKEPVFEVDANDAPETIFSGKGKRKNDSKGIVQIMTYIIQDLDEEIKNGMKDEEAAQLEFEKQLAAAEALLADLTTKKTDLKTMIARLGADKAAEEGYKHDNEVDLADEKTYKASITPDCDWIIGAFEHRAERRAAEMNGLVGAKQFLAGLNGGSTKSTSLQQRGEVAGRTTSEAFSQIRLLGLAH